MYLSHEEYQSMGGTLDGAAFSRYGYRAERIVDAATFGRVKAMQITPENVKRCVFELVEVIENGPTQGVASVSQSQGGVSQSVSFEAQAVSGAVNATISTYLADEVDDSGTKLLYRGCK